MLSELQMTNSIAFLAVLYPIISYFFRDSNRNHNTGKHVKKSLYISLGFVAAALAVLVSIELRTQPQNLYATLEISRHSSGLEIRQAYKKISKKLHPDKNPSPEAESQFQRVSHAYDILMDESPRDIYNRFGEDNIAFDPRHDELKLLAGMTATYIWWIVATFIFTAPVGARACRTWVAIIGISMLIAEVTLTVTESTLPKWMPATLTENELINYLHDGFPIILAALRCVAEWLYVDIDKTTTSLISMINDQQKELDELLSQLQATVKNYESSSSPQDLSELSKCISRVQSNVEQSSARAGSVLDSLKNSNSNPLAQYYWLIFVFMYVGIYFFQ